MRWPDVRVLRREGREVSKEAASLCPSPPLNGFCTSSRDRFTWLCCIRLPLSRGLQYSFAISQQHEEPVTAVAAIGFCVCSGFTSCLRRGQTFLKINTDGFLPSGFTLPTSLVDSESTFCRRLLLQQPSGVGPRENYYFVTTSSSEECFLGGGCSGNERKITRDILLGTTSSSSSAT